MTVPSAFITDMRATGVEAQSPWDLVNRSESYGSAIPVLIEWLERAEAEVPASERERFREGLVRSLTVHEARGLAGPALVREFRRPGSTPEYRWTVGNALEVVAGDDEFNDLVELASDRSLGPDRQMVVLALGRAQDPRAVEVLAGLIDDHDVVGHAVMALGNLRASEAREALQRCLENPRPWVRKEARKALSRIGA